MNLHAMNSPFTQEQSEHLNRLLPTLTEEQRTWLSGYLAASPNSSETPVAAVPDEAANALATEQSSAIETREVTVLFGSETANGQSLAEELSRKIDEQNIKVTTSALDDFKPKNFKKVQDLLIVTATHGEGEPPDNAITFYEFLFSRKAPKLKDVRFSVLSLGDQSYEFFCQTGKDFDNRLEELGGQRLYPRVDCDVDFDDDAAEWIDGVLAELCETSEDSPARESSPAGAEAASTTEAQTVYSRTNPFKAEIMENLNLNADGSNKETRHLELSLEGSNFEFEPGDSLGIFPENEAELVDGLINEMNWNSDEIVQVNKQGDTRSIRNALLTNFEITRLTKPLLEKAADMFSNDALSELMEAGQEDRKKYLDGRNLLDFIRDFPPQTVVEPGEFITILRKMPARLYSIANSCNANPDEVHLLIGKDEFQANGGIQAGVCSGQCAERAEPGDVLPVYIHRNPNFKLPSDPEQPVIMIGPGTGVAPYRSFLEEREELDVKGKTWLFYGDQHFTTDFLYQVEWQKWLQEGLLTNMDVAFSRDNAEKVYVQHRMLEKGSELYRWLQDGAHVYVCGDEKKMAGDVHKALLTILEQEGGMSHEEAEDYLKTMRQEKRYQRDVY